jgi:hypothetical protein
VTRDDLISASVASHRIGDIFVRYYDRLTKQDHRALQDAREVLDRLASEDAELADREEVGRLL